MTLLSNAPTTDGEHQTQRQVNPELTGDDR